MPSYLREASRIKRTATSSTQPAKLRCIAARGGRLKSSVFCPDLRHTACAQIPAQKETLPGLFTLPGNWLHGDQVCDG